MSKAMNAADIRQKLTGHPGWTYDGEMLRREFVFKAFSEAVLFVNAVAFASEQIDHHPDILIHRYRHVAISVKSHDVDGITRRDFRLVARIDALNE